MSKSSYDHYASAFQEYKCKLLTTKEEFDTTVSKVKYKKFKKNKKQSFKKI